MDKWRSHIRSGKIFTFMDKDLVFLGMMMKSYKHTLANDVKQGLISKASYYARIKKAEDNIEKIREAVWMKHT